MPVLAGRLVIISMVAMTLLTALIIRVNKYTPTWISGRPSIGSQTVKVSCILSFMKPVPGRVTLGSVIGTLLLLIYTDCMLAVLVLSKYFWFADNTKMAYHLLDCTIFSGFPS